MPNFSLLGQKHGCQRVGKFLWTDRQTEWATELLVSTENMKRLILLSCLLSIQQESLCVNHVYDNVIAMKFRLAHFATIFPSVSNLFALSKSGITEKSLRTTGTLRKTSYGHQTPWQELSVARLGSFIPIWATFFISVQIKMCHLGGFLQQKVML